MRAVPMGVSVELPMGPRDIVLGGCKYQIGFSVRVPAVPLGAGAPYGAAKRCTGWVNMLYWVFGTHADGGTGAFGGV
eukprot:4663762-Pyramimonas_sp.AAC.1